MMPLQLTIPVSWRPMLRRMALVVTVFCLTLAVMRSIIPVSSVVLHIFLPKELDPGSLLEGHLGEDNTQTDAIFGLRFPFFAPSALISLASDNATFFLARPAAFGPDLPDDGLTATLWTGRGFGLEFGCEKEVEGPGDSDSDSDSDEEEIKALVRDRLGAVPPGGESHIHGQIALVARGRCSFLEKIKWAEARDAAAVIVGDVHPNRPLVTMYSREEGADTNVTIPAVFTGFTTAKLLSRMNEGLPTEDPEDRMRSVRPLSITITLSPTAISPSPILDTILVLVVSPLVTLSIVYGLLLARSRLRRHRWRAPKSIVAQLPVRTYVARPAGLEPVAEDGDLESGASDSMTEPGRLHEATPLLATRGGEGQSMAGSLSYQTNVIPVGSYGSQSSSSPAEDEAISLGRSPQSTSSVHSLGSFLRNVEPNVGAAGTASSAPADQQSRHHNPDSKSRSTRRRQRDWQRRYSSQQRMCVVCIEDFQDGDQVMRLPCGHDFHQECITPWLTTRRRTCPMCNNDVVKAAARQERRHRRHSNHQRRSVDDSRPAGENDENVDPAEAQA